MRIVAGLISEKPPHSPVVKATAVSDIFAFPIPGLLRELKAGAIVADLKEHLGVGHGHAMAVFALLKDIKSDSDDRTSATRRNPTRYIDGFLIAVPTANKLKFIDHAVMADRVLMETGARRILDC